MPGVPRRPAPPIAPRGPRRSLEGPNPGPGGVGDVLARSGAVGAGRLGKTRGERDRRGGRPIRAVGRDGQPYRNVCPCSPPPAPDPIARAKR